MVARNLEETHNRALHCRTESAMQSCMDAHIGTDAEPETLIEAALRTDVVTGTLPPLPGPAIADG